MFGSAKISFFFFFDDDGQKHFGRFAVVFHEVTSLERMTLNIQEMSLQIKYYNGKIGEEWNTNAH